MSDATDPAVTSGPGRARPRLWRRILQVLREVFDAFRADRVTGLAGEVAFFAWLSLFPALLSVAAALGSLEVLVGAETAQRAEREIIEMLQRILTDEAAGTIDAVRQLFDNPNTGLITFGAVTTMWSASRGFVSVIHALDAAYDHGESRNAIEVRLLGLVLALGTVLVTAVMLVMLVAGPLFGTGADIADALHVGGVFAVAWDWFRWPVLASILIAWAATVYHLAPNHRSPWRWDLPGTIFTTIWWGLVSIGLRYYIGFAAEGNQVLGTLGGTVIAMIWLYLLAIGLLIGGELNAVLAKRAGVVELHEPRSRQADRLQSLMLAAIRRRLRRGSASSPNSAGEPPQAQSPDDRGGPT